MARSGARAAPKSENTQDRVLAAAIETLKRQGYAGTSAREIAKTGGFAQGVVFYYFGGMTELLVAALDATSRERLARYEAAVADVGSLPELVARRERRLPRGSGRGPRQGPVGAHRRRVRHPGARSGDHRAHPPVDRLHGGGDHPRARRLPGRPTRAGA